MKKGDIIKTVNQQHSFNELQSYNSVYCEINGTVQPFQFTDNELELANKRAQRNELDIPLMVETTNNWWMILIAIASFLIGCAI